jgi:HEAT repeat protein
MADATGKRLLRLLEPDQAADVRRAAVVVLGEIGGKDAQVSQALCQALDDADAAVRLEALAAVGKLRVERALPQLLARVSQGGPEAEAAAVAAAHLGARGTHALQGLMAKVAPGVRRYIAAALGSGGTASAETAAVEVLLDSDPNVVDAAVRSLLGEVPSLAAASRRAVADRVLELLGSKKAARPAAHSEAALLRLLAGLGDPRGEAIFWARTDPAQPPQLRAVALQALGTLPPPATREKWQRLLASAADADFRVAAPALMILKGATVADRNLDDWLALLAAPDPAARRFGLEKLGQKDHPKVAAALLAQIDHPDRSLREQALASLGQLKHGRQALVQALLEADSPDHAWTLARAQAPLAGAYAPALQDQIFDLACTYLEAGDRRADPLLFLLREVDSRALRDRLEERALKLRQKKQYPAALIYLRLLAHDPACGDPVRFELAACGLKVSPHDLNAEARAADPVLEQFAGLLNRQGEQLMEWVEKAKWLEAEDLFYLGFHFVERTRQEKEFGAEVLRLLLRRSPRAKLAKDAKNKLRSQGLK